MEDNHKLTKRRDESPTEKLLAEVREDIRNTHMSNDVAPRNSRLVEKLDRLVRIVEQLKSQRDKYASGIFDGSKMQMLLADDDADIDRIAECAALAAYHAWRGDYS